MDQIQILLKCLVLFYFEWLKYEIFMKGEALNANVKNKQWHSQECKGAAVLSHNRNSGVQEMLKSAINSIHLKVALKWQV